MMPPSGPMGQLRKTIVLPLLHKRRGNDLPYLNYIIIAHYNASYGCGKCLKQAFMSSSALHNHKKVCLRFITKKPAAGSDSKPSSGGGGDGSHGGSTRATPKKTPRLPPLAPRAPAPKLPHRRCHVAADERHPTTTSPTRTRRRTHQVTRRRRRQALPGRALATRRARTAASVRPTSTPALLFHQRPCIFSINYFVVKLVCLL